MFHLTKLVSCIVSLATLVAHLVEVQADEGLPPGRVGVHISSSFILHGNNASLQSWEFISPNGVLTPDPDEDASPWQAYLHNEPTLVHANSDTANSVLVNSMMLDVGSIDGWGQFDFWYTNADGQRVPGPIFPLSGVVPDLFELVGDIRDGSLTIVRKPVSMFSEGNWTYSYSIESPTDSMIPDPDSNATPYLTYLSNSESLISAATSNAVQIQDALLLDARFSKRDLTFKYEILGPELDPANTWLKLVQGNVSYIPEPRSLMLVGVGVMWILTSRPDVCNRSLAQAQ